MQVESIIVNVATLISIVGGVWLLSRQLAALVTDNANTKEDVGELQKGVNVLQQDMAAVKAVIAPERLSTPPVRKRTRR